MYSNLAESIDFCIISISIVFLFHGHVIKDDSRNGSKSSRQQACKGKRCNLDRYRSPLHLISVSIAYVSDLRPEEECDQAKIENSLHNLCRRSPEKSAYADER